MVLLDNPETSEALIAAPVVALYSPIVLPNSLASKRSFPERSMAMRLCNPETSEALIAAPVVASYSPIVPLVSVHDIEIISREGEVLGIIQPRDQRGVDRGPGGGVVFAYRVVGIV